MVLVQSRSLPGVHKARVSAGFGRVRVVQANQDLVLRREAIWESAGRSIV